MKSTAKNISARLSLRSPQEESLDILADVLERIELTKDPDLQHDLQVIQSMYPSVEDFERDFPSLCFALATGVGKTRLMGAFISYLFLTGRSRNFFILAPNLTIYEKLKNDFSPQSKKYVFRGILELASNPPIIVTGEDYDTGRGVRSHEEDAYRNKALFTDNDKVFINIFNISKINAKENKTGAAKSNTPRIKRLQETIGESYFEYLSNLPDLVVLMDEAHRYRASAGATAINQLKPVLGIELTATPKTIGSNSVYFKNIVYAYSLSEAMRDGYVKEPAVATRKDFDPAKLSPNQLEAVKLEDGIHYHEYVKSELRVYAGQTDKKAVKPFILVVAQDTEHARKIRELMESESFFEGRYKGKVAEVHSRQSGVEEDENIQKLISVEDSNEPTEIVIHVNKLKEGWDVTNLYTIIPLRASASEILTEQTMGRGLRLPYGRRTGVEAVDTLTIIAHDRFKEIIDRANDPESIIKKRYEIGDGGDIPTHKLQVTVVLPQIATALTGSPTVAGIESQEGVVASTDAIIENSQDKEVASIAIGILQSKHRSLDMTDGISSAKTKTALSKEVRAVMQEKTEYSALRKAVKDEDIENVVSKVTENYNKMTIEIPNIDFVPAEDIAYGFNDFNLNKLEELKFEPVSQSILIRYLASNENRYITHEKGHVESKRLEDYIVHKLIEEDQIDYERHADLLYNLSSQVVNHLKSYLASDKEVLDVLTYHQKDIAKFVIEQLMEHNSINKVEYRACVSSGFIGLKPLYLKSEEGSKPTDFTKPLKSKRDVKKIVFGGFSKCLYPLQKFDSVDGELSFAQILESDEDVLLWVKPGPGVFRIEYNNGEVYEPDFIVEAENAIYICEPKMKSEMDSKIVQEKKHAAVRWCHHATQYAKKNGRKPFRYALIPHDAIAPNKSFGRLMKEFVVDD